MEVKFIYKHEELRDVKDDITTQDIKALFHIVFGIEFDNRTCSFEKSEASEADRLAYTE